MPAQTVAAGPGALAPLILAPLSFWALAVAGRFNIGYRHVLPSLPFLYILGGVGIGKLGNWGLEIGDSETRDTEHATRKTHGSAAP